MNKLIVVPQVQAGGGIQGQNQRETLIQRGGRLQNVTLNDTSEHKKHGVSFDSDCACLVGVT